MTALIQMAGFAKTRGFTAPDYWVHLALRSGGASLLTAWRRAAGVSSAELALRAGVDLRRLLDLESGALASAQETGALARALQLDPLDLEE